MAPTGWQSLLWIGLPVAGLGVGLMQHELSRRLAAPTDIDGSSPVMPLPHPQQGRRRFARLWAFAFVGLAVGAWSSLQGDATLALASACFGWQLWLIAWIDGDQFWLPDLLTLPLLASGLAASAALPHLTMPMSAAGVVTGGLTLWIIAWAYRTYRGRDGLGGGDPILLAAIGAWVGPIGLPSVLVWASAAGLSLIGARWIVGRKPRATDRLPFGSCLAVGAWLTWLYGPIGF